jgi:hypothetical protein
VFPSNSSSNREFPNSSSNRVFHSNSSSSNHLLSNFSSNLRNKWGNILHREDNASRFCTRTRRTWTTRESKLEIRFPSFFGFLIFNLRI